MTNLQSQLKKTIQGGTQTLGVFYDTLSHLKRAQKASVPEVSHLKQQWAASVFKRLNVQVEVKNQPQLDMASIFVGNHISYLDIPFLMSVLPNVSFVAKNEVRYWPIFGSAAKKIDTVFVKRNNKKSRKQTRSSIVEALKDNKKIALFPSGTTSLNENDPWRKGIFEIAHSQQVFLQAFRISYTPLRLAAYIDRDLFLRHLYKLASRKNIKAKIEFSSPIQVTNPEKDCQYWQSWVRQKF